jgi:hypothetical protein
MGQKDNDQNFLSYTNDKEMAEFPGNVFNYPSTKACCIVSGVRLLGHLDFTRCHVTLLLLAGQFLQSQQASLMLAIMCLC